MGEVSSESPYFGIRKWMNIKDMRNGYRLRIIEVLSINLFQMSEYKTVVVSQFEFLSWATS